MKRRVAKKQGRRVMAWFRRELRRTADSHDVFVRTAEWRNRHWMSAPLTDAERETVAEVEGLDEEWT
jgi:hypothetical protein